MEEDVSTKAVLLEVILLLPREMVAVHSPVPSIMPGVKARISRLLSMTLADEIATGTTD